MAHRTAVALGVILPVVGAASWVAASEAPSATIHACVDRKNAAAELATLLAAGWQEKTRKAGSDHVVLRLERPRPMGRLMPSGPGTPSRPRR